MKKKQGSLQKTQPEFFEPGQFKFKSKHAKNNDHILAFMTYSPECSALKKICHEPINWYHSRNWDVFITGPMGGLNWQELRWIIINRVGLAMWDDSYKYMLEKSLNVWEKRWGKSHHHMTFYLDDLLLKKDSGVVPMDLANRSHVFVTANEPLREEFLKINPNWNIQVARTHIDVAACDRSDYVDMPEEYEKKCKILWASSGRVGTTIMGQVFQRAEKLNDFKDFQFFVVANQVGLVRKEFYQYNVNAHYLELMPFEIFVAFEKGMDMLINPMHADDVIYVSGPDHAQTFIDCKSEVKFCHSGALKKPLITSPQTNYLYAGVHNESMMVANTIDDWIEYMLELKKDKDLGKRLAHSARAKVLAEYDTPVRAEWYLKLFTGGYVEKELSYYDAYKSAVPPKAGEE